MIEFKLQDEQEVGAQPTQPEENEAPSTPSETPDQLVDDAGENDEGTEGE